MMLQVQFGRSVVEISPQAEKLGTILNIEVNYLLDIGYWIASSVTCGHRQLYLK
jgi:hypothetical protein